MVDVNFRGAVRLAMRSPQKRGAPAVHVEVIELGQPAMLHPVLVGRRASDHEYVLQPGNR